MKLTKVSIRVSEKLNLETYLGAKYKYCTLDCSFFAEAEPEKGEELKPIFNSLALKIDEERDQYKHYLVTSVKNDESQPI